jgi:uncharacterized protein (DUF58 family)
VTRDPGMKSREWPCRATRNLPGLLFVLGAMWYAGSSQGNAAAYLLLFALLSIFLVSIPHTLLNLGGLTATPESITPTFAGEEVSLPIEIANHSRATRRGIKSHLPGAGGEREDVDMIAAAKAARVTLRFPAPNRGQHEIKSLSLESTYPLGFLRAIKPVSVSQHYVVYPRPDGDPTLPVSRGVSGENQPRVDIGEGDDFAGVRAYVPGESQRHIDWKAVARGQALMTKQFTAESDNSFLYLDYAAAGSRHLEERLSQLALWVIEAERARRPYGLRLPGTEIAPSLGEQHFHRCLRTLALFK